MTPSIRTPLFAALLLIVRLTLTAAAPTQPPLVLQPSVRLQALVDATAHATLAKFTDQKLQTNQLALTLVELHADRPAEQASFRGDVQIYPASVIKLFYLAAAHQWLEDRKLSDTGELRRALKDMIVDSLNEATGLIVDSLTGTTSGPELPPDELEKWYHQRNAVNRYYTALGYQHINVNRKPWCEGPYGREMQSVKRHQPNHRNWLTTEATARLLAEIATGHAVTPARSEEMLALLKRRPFEKGAEKQSLEYTGAALPPGAKLWSKAGWTSEVRHDAACVELPDGRKFVLVTFTENHAADKTIIPAVAKRILEGLK